MSNSEIDLAVVPVAGLGTRLLPATKSQPKEMLPVGRKPVVQYVAEELALSGIRRLLFVTGARKTQIENHFDEDGELLRLLRTTGKEEQLAELSFERMKMEYFYTRQRRQLGLGDAIRCAEPLVGNQPFVVALGDSIIGLHAKSDIVRRMRELFVEEKAGAVVAFEQVPREEVDRYGVAEPRLAAGNAGVAGDVFELARIVEKPSVADAPSDLAVAARYVFDAEIFEHLRSLPPGKNGEIQLTDAIQRLIESGRKVLGVRLTSGERRFDIGNYESYFEAFLEFALTDPKQGKGLQRFVRRWLEEHGQG